MIENLYGTVTERTLLLYGKAWNAYQAFCGEDYPLVDAASVLAWRKSLVEAGYSPNTINSALSGIKSIFSAACAAGDVSVGVYTQVRAIASVSTRALRDRLRPSKDILTDASVMAILDAIDTTTLKGLRDRAILCVLATTGVRIEELSEIKLSDWDVTGSRLTVRGKTDTYPRLVPVSFVATNAMTKWLFARNFVSEWVFTSFAGRSLVGQDKPITTQGAYNAVVEAAKQAGVNISPHDFRRYVATRLASENIVQAQAVLGHASIMTTQRYVQRADLPSVDWLG